MDLNQNSDGKNVALEDSKSPSIFLEPNLNERCRVSYKYLILKKSYLLIINGLRYTEY